MEEGKAEIVKRHENDVTYSVQLITERRKIRTQHRNMLMAINLVRDKVDQTPKISTMKTKRLQPHNHNTREISQAEVEEIASISESNEQSDEDKLELTPQQLSFQAPSSSFHEGEKIEIEFNPRGKREQRNMF